jgi:hypothetical protein
VSAVSLDRHRERIRRSGHDRVIGQVAESVIELLPAEIGFWVFWHITTPGIHGVHGEPLCPTRKSQALTGFCAKIRRLPRKRKGLLCRPFRMGGTGLEPVTPSLSTRLEPLCPVAPFVVLLRQRAAKRA